MNWKIYHIKILILAVYVILAFSGCIRKGSSAISVKNVEVINCTGYIVNTEDSGYHLKSPYEGRIVWINSVEHTNKGTLMALIENPAFIDLQKEYLQARNNYDFYKDEYTRQGDLTVENATSIKKMQAAKRDFQAAEISLRTLETQLALFGVVSDSLKPESIHKSLPVYNQKKGVVSKKYIQKGDFVSEGEVLFEIIENASRLVKFQFPEQYYFKIHAGQKLDCRPASDTLTVLSAIIRNVTGLIDPENHMATGFAELTANSSLLIPGMSVKVQIYLTASDSIIK